MDSSSAQQQTQKQQQKQKEQQPLKIRNNKKPKKKTSKTKKQSGHEDIIDGFSFVAFKNYEELKKAEVVGEEKTEGICVQVVEGAEDKRCHAATNTSPLTTKTFLKQKSHHSKKKSKKLMDQENGDGERSGERSGPLPGTSPFATLNAPSPAPTDIPKIPKKPRLTPKESKFTNHFHDAEEKAVAVGPTEPIRFNNKIKISDGCSDLFPARKDSCSSRGGGIEEEYSLGGSLCSDGVGRASCSPLRESPPLEPPPPAPTFPPSNTTPPLATFNSNKGTSSTTNDSTTTAPSTSTSKKKKNKKEIGVGVTTNGNSGGSRKDHQHSLQNGHPPKGPQEHANANQTQNTPKVTPKVNSLFTPYATNNITRVSVETSDNNNSPPHSSPSDHHQYSNSKGASVDPLSVGAPSHFKSHPPTGKVTPTGSGSRCVGSGSVVFGSIARLLDSPNTTTSSSSSNRSSPSVSTNHLSLSPSATAQLPPQLPPSANQHPPPIRSHSPRGHSPSRERDSYSNVSSLSRTSGTPVSGASAPPRNLSPILPTHSFHKAASWLSSVPVPTGRTPPGVGGQQGGQQQQGGGITGAHPPLTFGGGSGLGGGMFAPPILPLGSMNALNPGAGGGHGGGHNQGHSSHFGPPPSSSSSSDPLQYESMYYLGASSNELVRRDFESRLMSAAAAAAGGGGPHSHHQLLPPPPTAQQQNPQLYQPPLFKEMGKVGLESGYYRANLGLSYGGFNGMLPPPPSFAPPSQLPTFTPKKTGRWNAMHVRIAWEIYQHQQKSDVNSRSPSNLQLKGPGGGNGSQVPSSSSASSSLLAGGNGGGGSLSSEMFRAPPVGGGGGGPIFPGGIPRPAEMTSYPSPLLSPHPHQNQRANNSFDHPPHPLFLPSSASHLGAQMSRYAGFGGLGSTFGGLSSLGSSLLSRDLQSLQPPPPVSLQEQWARMGRSAVPISSGVGSSGWGVGPPPGPQGGPEVLKREKGERSNSPFRDRSPVRPPRGGQGESVNGGAESSSSSVERTSRSSANHSNEKGTTTKVKQEETEKYSRTNTPLSDINKAPQQLPLNHPSRMYPCASPLSSSVGGSAGGWDTYGRYSSSGESFRLSLLQLGERERELSRLPPTRGIFPPSHPPSSQLTPLNGGPHSHSHSHGNSPSLNPMQSLEDNFTNSKEDR